MFSAQEETTPTVTFTLTIGRNVSETNTRTGYTMSNEQWGKFTTQIDSALSVFGATLYAKAESHGQYNGLPEAGCIWVGTLPGHAARLLRTHLADIARTFDQEAIGFIEQCNTDTLIFASA